MREGLLKEDKAITEDRPDSTNDAAEAKVSTSGGENTALLLVATSFASLFFELLIIRWLGCDFVSFGVFKTFPLVTCFVGLGTGVAKGNSQSFKLLPYALAVTVATIIATSMSGYGDLPFPSMSLYQWTSLSGQSWQPLALEVLKMTLLIILLLMGPFGVMFCIGSLIGELFNKMAPLRAYCLDIAGAIIGSITFGLLSFFFVSPNIEIAILSVLFGGLLLVSKRANPPALALLAATAIGCVLPAFNPANTIWSPYYRIDVHEINLDPRFTASGQLEKLGILLHTNHGFSQSFTLKNELKLSPEGEKVEAARLLAGFIDVRKHYYQLPYLFKKPKDVLILGAGSGSDVAEALRQGARVDAVEIDPGVINLARKYNPATSDPRVHYFLDDGRRYLSRTDKKYDLIILACLDSRAVSGTGSSLRTDCYIHTKESYQDCIKHLNDDGIVALSFGASVDGNSQWLRNRIYKTLEDVTGYPPVVLSDEKAPVNWPAYFFITGEPVHRGLVVPPMDPKTFCGLNIPKDATGIILSDDWPFLYIKDKGLDLPYLAVTLLIILITVYVGRSLVFAKKTGSDMQLFGLGAAFILVELQAISRLSLIYGATWLTSSVVINGVLLMILAANYLVIKAKKPFNQHILYGLLFLSLLASYCLPVTAVLAAFAQAHYIGMAVVTLFTLLPILMAGLIFATAFNIVKEPSRSFAFNLLGSVLGGLLEYLSTYLGINNLVLVALAIYVLSYLGARNAMAIETK